MPRFNPPASTRLPPRSGDSNASCRELFKCRPANFDNSAIPTLFITLLHRDAVIRAFSVGVERLRALGPGAAHLDACLDSVPALPEMDFDLCAHRR